jgi:hypothetical protein
MKLKWIKVENGMNIYAAETARYRFIMVAPPRSQAALAVHHLDDEPGDPPIDERMCRTRRGAERYAHRFANKPNAKRLV